MEKNIYRDNHDSKVTIKPAGNLVRVTVEARQAPCYGDANCFAGPTVFFPLEDYSQGLKTLRDSEFCEIDIPTGYMKITKNGQGEVHSIQLSDKHGSHCSADHWEISPAIRINDLE